MIAKNSLTEDQVREFAGIPTDVEDVLAKSIAITTKQKIITITNTGDNVSASIYNLSGGLISKFKMFSGSKSISLNKAGVYLVSIKQNDGFLTQKVLLLD